MEKSHSAPPDKNTVYVMKYNNLLIHYETWACLIENNAYILRGILTLLLLTFKHFCLSVKEKDNNV